ncbi:MAG: proline iminopeptidase [Hyphomicrobiaceae bacterium]|jgi:proline iminopeptidase
MTESLQTSIAPVDLFPEVVPYLSGTLAVSDLHTLYFEESGNPDGIPLVFLHGGPGGGVDPIHRRFYDPAKWRIVLFDQRGCGQSTPHAELRENTTWDLVADIERLRVHLGIERWTVAGGSWGSTLALAYAQSHPKACLALILRGIFMLRPSELQWFYQDGASHIFPDAWEHYLEPIPLDERGDMIAAYYARLTGEDDVVADRAARAWAIWEASTSKLTPDPDLLTRFADGDFARAFARIEAHYFVNGGFFEHDDELLRGIDRIREIPAVIVQGRYDVVCPMRSAWDLHQAWPEAKLVVVGDAGHSMGELGIRRALVAEADRLAGELSVHVQLPGGQS